MTETAPGSDLPLWRQIAETLRAELAGRPPGHRLPSEARLAAHWPRWPRTGWSMPGAARG